MEMARSITTTTDVFSAYEEYARDIIAGRVNVDMADVRLYGVDAATLTPDQAQADFVNMAAMLLFGERGVGVAAPSAVRSVRDFETQVAAMLADARGLAIETSQPTAAELQARAVTLADEMLAQFDAAVATNAALAALVPSTEAERILFRGAVGEAMKAMTDARNVYGDILAGNAGPEDIAVASAAGLRAATSLLSALPLPPAAKAAVNVVNMATFLVPGIIAAAKGDGDPTALLTIAVQSVTSILTWGVSDYVFDYVLPIVVLAAANAATGAAGPVDLSPTAINQGLIEAAVHDNGGTLPDWWYTAGGGDSGAYDAAKARSEAISAALTTVADNLYAQIAAQYGNANFYQELTLTFAPELGPREYVFGRLDGVAYKPAFVTLFDGTTDPWGMVNVLESDMLSGNFFGLPAPHIRQADGVYLLEPGTLVTTFSDHRDTVFAHEGQRFTLLGGDDRFTLRQDADGRPGHNTSNHYATAVMGIVDGGDGIDTLDLTLITGRASQGYAGDLYVTQEGVYTLLTNSAAVTTGGVRQLLGFANFEGIEVGDLRLADFRGATHGIKLATVDSTTPTDLTEIFGSAYGDTFIVDTSRYVNGAHLSGYGESADQLVRVDAGSGHDYVAGELVNGAAYEGGAGVDTFEILLPDSIPRYYFDIHLGPFFFSSLDLESGATTQGWSHIQLNFGGGGPLPNQIAHIDTRATVTGFEWAVGSAEGDTIYARNAGSRISGMEGHDNLVGRDGNDQLMGGRGNDAISGGEGVNRLEGGAGNDIITGGSNRDVILGGTGNDTITDIGGDNLIHGGDGNDVITAGDGNDEIIDTSGSNWIVAGDGNNDITLGAGDDRVFSGSGHDVVSLGAGLDEATTGAGDDRVTDIWAPGIIRFRDYTYQPFQERNPVIDTGEGFDVVTLDYSGQTMIFEDSATFNDSSFSYDIVMGTRFVSGYEYRYDDETRTTGAWYELYAHSEVRNAEEIILTNGTFVVDLISYADLDFDFHPYIDGHNIHNTVQTWDNDDTVSLGAGNDRFYVNLGNDTVAGEEGSDTLDFSRLGSEYTVDLSGLDAAEPWSINIRDASGTVVATDTASGFENVVGTGHSETITLGAGANVITGGGGDDTLTGGAGLDRFRFGTQDGNDTVTDLALGEVLEFVGTATSPAPVLVRKGTDGNYTYTVTFDQTVVRFTSPDLLDLNGTMSTVDGTVTWEMTLVDGAVQAVDDAGVGFETGEDSIFVTADTLLNDIDPGLTDATITAFDATSAGGALVTLNAGTGTFNYDPNGAFEHLAVGERATDTFTYTISDGTTTHTAIVTVVVNGQNDATVTAADTATVNEDAAVDIDVLANDTDMDTSDVLSVTAVTDGAHGVVTINPDGTVRYVPNANFNGTDSFTYTVTDGHGSRTETVSVTVAPQPDPIATTADTANLTVINGNRTIQISPLANDSHVDGTLSISSLGNPANGTAVLNSNGTVSYTANEGFAGKDTFTYTVLSSSGAETTDTVTVNVQTNLAPLPHRVIWRRGVEETPITINPLAWVYDPNGDALSIVDIEQLSAGAGQITLNDDGTLSLTPAQNFNGGFAFYYTVSDGELESTFYANIWFENTPDAPVGVDDHVGIDPNASTWINVLANDVDPDLVFGQMEARLMTGVTPVGDTANNATVEIDRNGLLVTPNAGFVGTLTFEYTLRDPGGLTSSATATIYVSSLPQLIADGYAVLEDSGTHVFDVLANDSDTDAGQVLTITDVTGAVGGTVSVINGGQDISYTPDADFTGVETLTYTVSDGLRETTQMVTITVTNTPDTPVAGNDAASTAEDTAVTIDVLANDADPGTAVLSILSATDPAHGTVTISGNKLIYTPDVDFSGLDTLTYTVTDGAGGTTTATVNITVTAVNDAPVAADTVATLGEDGSYSFDPLAGASDVEGSPVTLVRVNAALHGTATRNADGTVSYVPPADYNGADSFTYVISDGTDETTVTVSLTVEAVNDAPVATGNIATTQEDKSIAVDVLANDTDVDGDVLSIVSVADPANGIVTFEGGTITYTPDANFHGNEFIVYTVSDGAGGTATATLTITVEAVADAPVTASDASAGSQSDVQTLDVRANDVDGDGDALTVVALNGTAVRPNDLVQLPSGALLRLNADGTVSLLPLDAYRYLGATETITETVTYTIDDGTGRMAEGTASFTINGTNDAPVAIDFTQPGAAPERSAVSIAAGAAFTDVDQTDTLTFSATLADGSPLPSGLQIDAATGLITGLLPANTSGTSSADQTIKLRVTADDGADTGTLDVVLAIQNVNDTPTYDQIGTRVEVLSDAETALDLSGLNLADIDSPVVTLTLAVDAGSLAADPVAGVAVLATAQGLALTGTPAALNAYLAQSVRFVDPASEAFGQSAYLTITLTDGDGSTVQTLPAIAIVVAGVDDATRVEGALSDQTLLEDTTVALDFSGVTLIDTDTVLITLSGVASDRLTAQTSSGVSINRPDADTLTLAGTAADISAYLATAGNVTFTPPPNENGTFGPVQVTASGLNGEAPVLVGEIGLNVVPVADPVLMHGLSSSQTYVEDTISTPATNLILASVDMDLLNGGLGDYTGSFVEVQALPGQRPLFGISDGATVQAVQIDDANWALQAQGETFGHFRLYDAHGRPFARFDFDGGTATPTTALVNDALHLLTFQTGLDQISGTQTTRLTWSFSTQEGVWLQSIQSDIAIQFVNDPVELRMPATPYEAKEGGAPLVGLARVKLVDGDNADLWVLTISVDTGTLSFSDPLGILAGLTQIDPQTITMIGVDFDTANEFLQQFLTYTPPDELDVATTAQIRVLYDHFGPSPNGHSTFHVPVHVLPVNDPAVVAGDITAQIAEDGLTVSGVVSVNDVDGPNEMQAGTFQGTFGSIDISADGHWTYALTGTFPDLGIDQTAQDNVTVFAADGTEVMLSVTINGINNAFEGTVGDDTLRGTRLDDTFRAFGGHDTIDGGAGQDIVHFDGTLDEFVFSVVDGQLQVADAVTGDEGIKALSGIETLQFADKQVDVTVTQTNEINSSIVLTSNGTSLFEWNSNGPRPDVTLSFKNGDLTTRSVTDGTGTQNSAAWESYVDTFNADGSLATRSYVFDDAGTRQIAFEYTDGIRTGRAVTDGTGAQNSAAWSSYVDAFKADGSLATRSHIFDDGGTRLTTFEYIDGIRTGRTVTDGAGPQNSAAWESYLDTFNADGSLATRSHVFDDGGTRLTTFEYIDGIRTGRTVTDGTGPQNSAAWESYADAFNADGSLATRSYVFDDGGTRQIAFDYTNSVRTGRTVTDGDGVQSREAWQSYVDDLGANGLVDFRILHMDNGDRIEVDFSEGIRVKRTHFDLSETQPFESKTDHFDLKGSLTHTDYVWDFA